MTMRAILLAVLVTGCAGPLNTTISSRAIKKVHFVKPASLDQDGVVVCVYKSDLGYLRCMTPEDAYLVMSEGKIK